MIHHINSVLFIVIDAVVLVCVKISLFILIQYLQDLNKIELMIT